MYEHGVFRYYINNVYRRVVLRKGYLSGSEISAEEKWKKLKDGTHVKYIYYSCNGARDGNCKNHYI